MQPKFDVCILVLCEITLLNSIDSRVIMIDSKSDANAYDWDALIEVTAQNDILVTMRFRVNETYKCIIHSNGDKLAEMINSTIAMLVNEAFIELDYIDVKQIWNHECWYDCMVCDAEEIEEKMSAWLEEKNGKEYKSIQVDVSGTQANLTLPLINKCALLLDEQLAPQNSVEVALSATSDEYLGKNVRISLWYSKRMEN